MKLKETFDGFLAHLAMKGYQERTISDNKRFLLGALSHSVSELEIDSLKLTDALKVREAGKKHGEYGPQRSIDVFRQLLKYYREDGIPVPIDYRDIEVPKPPHKENESLTDEEFELLMNALPLHELAGLRSRALLELLYSTGLRISEACSIDQKHVNWEEHEIPIVNAKTRDHEKVYFSDRAEYWLRRYLDARKDKDLIPALFVSGRGRLLTITSRNFLAKYLRQVPIKKDLKNHIHHIFRKTFTTHLIDEGAKITEVRLLARHASPRTTLRYYAVADKEKTKETHQRIFNRSASPRIEIPDQGVALSRLIKSDQQPEDSLA